MVRGSGRIAEQGYHGIPSSQVKQRPRSANLVTRWPFYQVTGWPEAKIQVILNPPTWIQVIFPPGWSWTLRLWPPRPNVPVGPGRRLEKKKCRVQLVFYWAEWSCFCFSYWAKCRSERKRWSAEAKGERNCSFGEDPGQPLVKTLWSLHNMDSVEKVLYGHKNLQDWENDISCQDLTIAHFAFRRACPCRGKGAFVSKAAMQDRFRCSSTDTKGYKATQGDCERFPKIPKIVTKYSQSQFQFYHNHCILELYSVARSNYKYKIIIIIMVENNIQ